MSNQPQPPPPPPPYSYGSLLPLSYASHPPYAQSTPVTGHPQTTAAPQTSSEPAAGTSIPPLDSITGSQAPGQAQNQAPIAALFLSDPPPSPTQGQYEYAFPTLLPVQQQYEDDPPPAYTSTRSGLLTQMFQAARIASLQTGNATYQNNAYHFPTGRSQAPPPPPPDVRRNLHPLEYQNTWMGYSESLPSPRDRW